MLAAIDEVDAPETARQMMREYFEMASTAMINS
jgi:truncated hemoglobin YjbI